MIIPCAVNDYILLYPTSQQPGLFRKTEDLGCISTGICIWPLSHWSSTPHGSSAWLLPVHKTSDFIVLGPELCALQKIIFDIPDSV